MKLVVSIKMSIIRTTNQMLTFTGERKYEIFNGLVAGSPSLSSLPFFPNPPPSQRAGLRRLSKSRQVHRSNLTRLFNELDRLLSDYGNIVRVKEIQTKLDAAWVRFEDISHEYIASLTDNPSELKRTTDQVEQQQAKKFEFDLKIDTLQDKANAHYSRSPVAATRSRDFSAANITWPLDTASETKLGGYSAPPSSVGSRRTLKSNSSKWSVTSERLHKAEHELERSRIMEEHAEQQGRRSIQIESRKLEMELERRIEIAKLEAQKSIEEAKNRTRLAQMEVDMARREFLDVEREDVIEDTPRDNVPVPHGSRSKSSSLQAELSQSKLSLDRMSDISSPPFKLQPPPSFKPLKPQVPQFTYTPPEPIVRTGQTQLPSHTPGTSQITVPQGNNNVSSLLHSSRPSNIQKEQPHHSTDVLQTMVNTMELIGLSQTLPAIRVRKFCGNPEEFPSFRQRFYQLVESKPIDESVKMTTLLQYLEGPALKVALPYETIPNGMKKALDVLQRRFGQPCQIVRACVDKLTKGMQINYNDKRGLQTFADDVESTYETLKSMSCLQEVNMDHLERIILRLPRNMQAGFGEYLRTLEEKGQSMPKFENVVHFLKIKSSAVNHPFFSRAPSEGLATRSATQTHSTPKPTTMLAMDVTTSKKEIEVSKTRNCLLCSNSHPLYSCDLFKSKPVKDRREFVCISTKRHMCRACPSSSRCKFCGKSHHSLLHDPSRIKSQQSQQHVQSDAKSPQVDAKQSDAMALQTNNLSSNETTSALLQVVPIAVIGDCGRSITTYALIDSGSDATLIDESLASELGIKGEEQTFYIDTVTEKNVQGKAAKVNFKVSSLDSQLSTQVEVPFAWAVKDLSIPLRHSKRSVNELQHLQSVPFPEVERIKISVLLGTNVPEAFIPIEVRTGPPNQPFAIKTVIGWSVLGRNSDHKSTLDVNCTCSEESAISANLERFWKIESCGTESSRNKTMSVEDRQALKVIEETIAKVDGHYKMGLLWRTKDTHLPFNRPLAEIRLHHLKVRLKTDDVLRTKYQAVIKDYLNKGYARKLSGQEASVKTSKTWYLPHHPVLNPNKPGKVRVVFDAAAKYKGMSLNDNLLHGPDLANDLVGVMIRFREDFVAFTSDIEAMFHQTRVSPPDTDALWFLWWSDSLDQSPEDYKMLVHIFGAKSSPCCANKTLKQLAEDNKERYDKATINAVYRNFYVDDQLKSVTTIQQAIRLAKQLIDLLKEGGYNLTKFMSNSREVLATIPPHQRAKPDLNLDLDELPIERALGLRWNPENDCFYFNTVNIEKPQTKRGILSVVSSLYDPLGFLSPFVLLAKILIQDLWRMKCTWDESIQEPYVSEWNNWLDMLKRVEHIAIPRCYKHLLASKIANTQLHLFSDASKQGLSASCYIRTVDASGLIHVVFVVGKTRNTPLKDWSIPRLELQAAVMSARLYEMVKSELDMTVDEAFLWVDSMTVLQYIMNTTRRFRPFVAYRVSEIHELTAPTQWKYVPGPYNPADGGSRGMKIDEFNADCRWWSGPQFLCYSEDQWPQSPLPAEIPLDDKELDKPKASITCITSESPIDLLLKRISSWSRLRNSIAWILRFIKFIRKQSPTTGPLQIKEIRDATRVIARLLQRQFFQDELQSLQKGTQVAKRSKLANLNPIMIDGLICVGGRTSAAPASLKSKHPIILPKSHAVTTSIVRFYHESYGHAGKEHVMALVRQVFWIVQARSLVRSTLRRCVICRKHNESTMKQMMADLPKERLTPFEPPFTFTGVDVFGPFTVKRGRTTQKIYGCLFVCFNSRAIHIEDLSSLDTDSFINALRRFFSNRGLPKEIWSDNGTNFVGAERELKQAMKELNQEEVITELRGKDVEWHNTPFVKWKFQPPGASHMSGVWERLVRSVKKSMKGVLGSPNALVSQETLRTVFADVTSILNSRPLCPVSDDPRDLEPITPNHLLLQRQTLATPPGIFTDEDMHGRKKWKCAQFLANCFWARWLREYVPLLQVRQKWIRERRNLRVKDLVLIADYNIPRGRWPLGRVQKVFPGRDGRVRSAEVKTKTSTLVRPITKLCLLEESGQ